MSTIKVTFEFPERWLEHVEHHEERLQLAREGQFYAADYDSQEEAERAEASALEGGVRVHRAARGPALL